MPDADVDVLSIGQQRKNTTAIHNAQNAFTIPDQRSAGLHPPSLGAISVLRPNVQPPATATTTERRLGLCLVPATIRRW